MRCCIKFGGIIQFWHCVLVICLQSYVLVRSIQGYLNLRSQIYDARHGLDWDTAPLNFYINCIVFSSAFTVVMTFLLFAGRDYPFLGNFSISTSHLFSDTRLSNNVDSTSNRTGSSSPVHKKGFGNLKKKLRFAFPLAFLFHALAAYFLLLPIPWVIGEQAKNEAISPSKFQHFFKFNFIF